MMVYIGETIAEASFVSRLVSWPVCMASKYGMSIAIIE